MTPEAATKLLEYTRHQILELNLEPTRIVIDEEGCSILMMQDKFEKAFAGRRVRSVDHSNKYDRLQIYLPIAGEASVEVFALVEREGKTEAREIVI